MFTEILNGLAVTGSEAHTALCKYDPANSNNQ